MCGAVCVRACGRGPGRIDLSAWLVLSWSFEPSSCSPVDDGGRGRGGRSDVESGAPGKREGNYQLAERAPDNAGEGQVGVWLKEGRSGRRGREGGDVCSLALTSAGEGLGTPPPRPRARTGMRRGGGAGEGAPGETRGQSSPAAGRMPLSRSVKLNKEGICVFLTSAGYLIDS